MYGLKLETRMTCSMSYLDRANANHTNFVKFRPSNSHLGTFQLRVSHYPNKRQLPSLLPVVVANTLLTREPLQRLVSKCSFIFETFPYSYKRILIGNLCMLFEEIPMTSSRQVKLYGVLSIIEKSPNV